MNHLNVTKSISVQDTDNPIVNHWNYLNGTMGRWDAGRFLRTTGTHNRDSPFCEKPLCNF